MTSVVDNKTLGDLIVEPALGIDVARWQNEVIPYRASADLGIRFVSVKFWHGPWRGDAPTRAAAERQYKDAKNEGLLAGQYAWWIPSHNWEEQVAAWCAVTSDDDLPLSIDCEENPTNKAQARLDLIAINNRCKQLTGRSPIIYGGRYWIDQWIGTDESEELAESPLWLPAYPRKAARDTNYAGALAEWLLAKAPGEPAIWKDQVAVAWQLDGSDDNTGTGALRLPNGIDVDVDLADWVRLSALVPALSRLRTPVSPTLAEYALQAYPEKVSVNTVLDDVSSSTGSPTLPAPDLDPEKVT